MKEDKTIINRTNQSEEIISALRPESFLAWQGAWPAGRIEPNRILYDYELVYVSAGKGYVATGEESHYCEAGSLLIIPPGTVHFTRAESRIERWCIHFDWYGNCRAQKELELPYIFLDGGESFREEYLAPPPPPELGIMLPLHLRLGMEKREELLTLLRRYFAEVPDSPKAAFLRRGLLWQILSFALEKPATGESSVSISTLFFQAKGMLDQNFRDPGLQIGSVAKELCITPNHLLKLFRSGAGMSTQSYLLLRRLEYAEKLLWRSRLSIGEIAEQAGFPDANYFARFFRRKHGESPREWRRSRPVE